MEFNKLITILLRRRKSMVYVFIFFVAVFSAVSFLSTPSYEAKTKLLVSSSDALTSILAELDLTRSSLASTEEDIYQTKMELARIRPLLKDIISSLALKDRHGDEMTPENLIDSSIFNRILPQPYIKIKQYDDTAVFKIIARSKDPELCRKMAEKFAELYIDYSIKRTQAEYESVKTYLGNNIEDVQNKYSSALTAIQSFKTTNRIVDLDMEQENMVNKLNDLTSALEETNKTLALTRSKIARTEKELKAVAPYRTKSKEFVRSSSLSQLEKKLNEMLIKLAENKTILQKDHPDYQKIEQEIVSLRALIRREKQVILEKKTVSIDPLRDDLSSSLTSLYIAQEEALAKKIILEKFIHEYEVKLIRLPTLSAEYAKLELALSVNKSFYEELVTYLKKVSVAEAITISDTRIIEHSVLPTKKKYPKKGLNLIIGIILGAFWGILTALFLEYIDDSVWCPQDIQHIQGCKTIGYIPYTKQFYNKQLIIKMAPVSSATEAFRIIKNQLEISNSDSPQQQTILVTSISHNEGKSCVAANLAIAYAKSKKKVLLIDLHLLKPALHTYFAISNTPGVVDVLQGTSNLQEARRPATIKKIELLPSGLPPTDPANLIDSVQLHTLIRSSRREFDIVILDTAPLVRAHDAVILAAGVDSCLLVVQTGTTRISAVEQAVKQLQPVSQHDIALVFNRFPPNSIC